MTNKEKLILSLEANITRMLDIESIDHHEIYHDEIDLARHNKLAWLFYQKHKLTNGRKSRTTK